MARDPGDRRGHEVGVGVPQRRRPPPVVAQRTLGERREVGHHLLEELVVVHLRAQDVDQHGAHEVVALAHGLGLPVPVRIHPGGRQQALVHDPELPQPVPAPVIGQQGQQVVELGRERVLVIVGRQQPGRRALVHVEVAHLPGQAGDELGGAGPCPDHRHPPTLQFDRVVPRRRVERGSSERLPALQGGKRRPVELAHRADDRVECMGPLGPVAVAHRQRPHAGLVVEARLGHLGREADAVPEPQPLGHPLQVRQQVGLRREPRDPVVGLGEGEAVELIGHVDTAPGVDVLEPGAAHVAVLLEHRDRDAGLSHPVRRSQTRSARPDHGAAERATHLVHVPCGPAGIAPRQGELLHEEGGPLVGRVHAHQEAEDPPPHVLVQCRLRRSGVALSQESGCGQAPRLHFLFGRQAASGDEELPLVRLEVPTQQ